MKGDIVGAANGTNHFLTGNPKRTMCGQQAAQWAPANTPGRMCKNCENGNKTAATLRPMPNNQVGVKRA